MLTSKKALLSNLNYVHLQHVSLGIHLSMHPEVNDAPSNQDTGMKHGCPHKWKDTTMMDPNSNDPSMPCQCCDQHSGQEPSSLYSSLEDLDTIICDEYLSPDDLPLSPLSLSSPSTDSSSSSDFTLEDSPASMYYKEYSQDGLDTPDQQPDIIPLDAATEGPFCPETSGLSPQKAGTTLNSNSSENNNPEITNNNNMEAEETPFIDWGSNSMVDSNSNTLIERSGSSSIDSDTIAVPEVQTNKTGQGDDWAEEQDLLPGLPPLEKTSTLTPKKMITSFHELALRRRRSGGQLFSQPKRDRSDWLIVFSPDTEQPPINELTASAFYHGILEPQTHPLPAGKEVTTFRELRYRNTLNKQSVQQKVHEGRTNMTPTEATTEPSYMGELQRVASQQLHTTKTELEEAAMKEGNDQRQRSHRSSGPQTANANIPPGKDDVESRPPDTLPAIRSKGARHEENPEKKAAPTVAEAWIRGMADGGDRRGQEVAAGSFSNVLLQVSNLRPLYPYSPPSLRSSGPDLPRPFGSAQLPWYPGFPPRLSPVGAFSPPHRALLPLLDTPDVAVLLSPMFPRRRTIFRLTGGHEAGCRALTDPQDTGTGCELLMAADAGDSTQRQKKSLLIAVGSSVEKIISHFNTSRNQVQKAQLGDSRLSPVLGYLILNHLCPSLYSLLGDGLKPYQKDVIIGRRRLSPWSLVEASMKTGPETVHLLFSKVNRLTQLRDPQRKFNAFIFGLLNMKQLDVWFLHLHQTFDVLSVFYLPSGFLPLAATLRLQFRDELLLSLQPLSALTFHIDLLFEHHHLSLQDLPTPHRVHGPGRTSENWAVPSLQNILDLGGWITHNLTRHDENKAPTPTKGSSLDECSADGSTSTPAGDTSVHPADTRAQPSSDTVTKELLPAPDAQTSPGLTPSKWWGHLSQASRIYIPANRESLTFTSLRKLTSWVPTDKEPNPRASESEGRDFPRLTKEVTSGEASETSGNEPQDKNLGAPYTVPTPGTSDAERVKTVTSIDGSGGQCPSTEEKGNWLGQLFGASSSHGREIEARSIKSRRPSSWLLPNVNVWNIIMKQSTPGKPDILYQEEDPRHEDSSRPQRSLRALCDHAAAGEAQLSFKKGDVLQLLGTVDEDWIQCRRGSDTGLVPVGYTSLIL